MTTARIFLAKKEAKDMVRLLEEKPHQLELLRELTTKKAPFRILFKG